MFSAVGTLLIPGAAMGPSVACESAGHPILNADTHFGRLCTLEDVHRWQGVPSWTTGDHVGASRPAFLLSYVNRVRLLSQSLFAVAVNEGFGCFELPWTLFAPPDAGPVPGHNGTCILFLSAGHGIS